MPYGIRYIAMCLRKDLKEKFPESPDEEIMKAVGTLLFYTLSTYTVFLGTWMVTIELWYVE